MRQVLIRALNIALVAVCSYQGAKVANLVAAETLHPPYTYDVGEAPATPALRSGWETRQTILDRNLFGAKLVDDGQAALEVVVDEDVEETKLPLVLEATVASPNTSASWAAVHDKQSRETVLLRVGEEIEGHAGVSVASIERRRILLKNSGRHEELLLNEDVPTAPGPSATVTSDSANRARAARRSRRPDRTTAARIRQLREGQVQNMQDELTLEEITAEIERLRELEEP